MPKMSFGTGHHQTTRLICTEMLLTDFIGKRVLDMGCGTGILAILAKKLGAQNILGIDNDAWSVENALENCQVNECNSIQIKLGDDKTLANEEKFDIIIANINKNILSKHMATYSAKLSEGGKLFLSGFFTTDVEQLKEIASANDLKFSKTLNENEWAMLLLNK
jgi:ribosomal protein L11 methyltransferase